MMTEDLLVDCLRIALDAPCGKPELPKSFDWDELYKVSYEQDVAQVVAVALMNHPDWESKGAMFKKHVDWCINFESTMYFELGDVLNQFEKEGIDYFPFKGYVMKELYPLPWMRTMGDADILVRAKDLDRVKTIMVDAGYSFERHDEVHDVYNNCNMLYQVEMHQRLLSVWSNHRDWEVDIWDKLYPVEPGSHRMTASYKDMLIIFLAHFDKERNRVETSARSAIDFWLMPHAHDEYTPTAAINEIGLQRAYDILYDVTRTWFLGEPMPDRTYEFYQYFMRKRISNAIQHKYDIEMFRWNGHKKLSHKNLKTSLHPNENWLKQLYPVLYKRGWLMPFFLFVHIFERILRYSTHHIRVLWYRIRGAVSQE